MNTTTAASERPTIHMIAEEADQLSDLALSIESRFPDVAALLLRETNRARLHKRSAMPADVVTMGASVEFLDEGSGARRTVTLAYPSDADIERGRISILTPVAAGLIGLREGQSILWPDRDGRRRSLVIVKVTQPACTPPDAVLA